MITKCEVFHELGQFLSQLLLLRCGQMLAPPQSLHLLLWRLCWQMQSLQMLLMQAVRKKCPQGRERSRCVECGGCAHRRQRRTCKDCGGTSICQHNRLRNTCKDCAGTSICQQNGALPAEGARGRRNNYTHA